MSIELTIFSFIHLLASILGLLCGIVLWVYSQNKSSAGRWLSLALLSLSIGLGIDFLIESKLIFSVPHLYRVGNIFGLLFIPFSYLYVRSLIQKDLPTKRDAIHFIPVLFFIIDFIPFYSLSRIEKVQELMHDFSSIDAVLAFDEGWLTPPGFHLPFRTFLFALYWLFQIGLLAKLYNFKIGQFTKSDRQPWQQWLEAYIVIEVFIFLPYTVTLIFDTSLTLWGTIQMSAAATLILTTAVLFLLKPTILYDLEEHGIFDKGQSTSAKIANNNGNDSDSNSLDEETVNEILSELEILMTSELPYLNHGYTLSNLSSDIGFPYHQISVVINQHYGVNFNDYINQYRVEFCKKRIKHEEWDNLTLEAISQECGFNNRNSFTIAFKKFEGITPSAYLKSIKKNA